ncbi:type II secretion system protein GspM [Sinorhizobium meliloti]|uniref:type II secretion system protein GspM n=1 Tax=Rhizobium meliloti TaxID=382 RepID=UPI001F209FDE|nr:type II secretion system protein GspM [Sinorhizobium meliloti]
MRSNDAEARQCAAKGPARNRVIPACSRCPRRGLYFCSGTEQSWPNLFSEIEEKRRLLGRLEAIKPAASVFLKTNPMPALDNDQLFLQGENEAVITADLQGWLQERAVTAGAQINSVSNVRLEGENGITLLGLRANMSGSMEAIHEIVAAVEVNQPRLFIKEMDLQSNHQEAYGLDTPPELSATILVLGATEKPGQTKGADQ